MRHAGAVYSLVSSAVLAADLVRHPRTARVADTLDRVFALTPEESGGLRGAADDQVRRRVLDTSESPPRVSSALDELRGHMRTAESVSAVVTRLEDALLGSLDDLHALVLREAPLRSLGPDAQQVALDALTAAWVGPEVPLRDVHALGAPWEAALSPVPPALPERSWSRALRDLLDEVARRTPEQWRASTARERRACRSLRWSEALHEASIAAWRTDRLHDVARAQLAAARALTLTHTGVSPYASARVLTAAVQGVCTADVLDPSVSEALRADWEAGSAPR
ncbi:MAG: hypothetical protein M3P04_04900 [Actinomycetota bacterium]|nr:hypothetical protein [Actinomycetota bacterium]